MAGEFEGKVIADRYRLGPVVASGGIEVLHRGTHLLLDRPVLVKLIAPGLLAEDAAVHEFLTKARIEGKGSHPNLLKLTDFGSDSDGSPYAVYENAEVETLRSYLDRNGRLDPHVAIEITRQASAALAAAHHIGIVHGGLSPGNILVTNGGLGVKLFDFGAHDPFELHAPAYTAPELFSGEMRDARSDVYSLGAVLYEMLAGEPPFAAGKDKKEIVRKSLEMPPSPLSAFRSDVPAHIEPVVLKSLAKDPDLRYQTAEEFAAALAPAAAAAAAGPANNIWKTAFIVLAGITLLSAFLIYATAGRQTNPMTALPADANGQPVQPINPATGAEEQNLVVPGLTAEQMANTNMSQPPGTLPGGDNYDPWARGGAPPPGAPAFPRGGQTITIDPNGQSPFMPGAGCIMQPSGILLCPAPITPTANTAKPSPTPKTPPANANTATAVPTPKPVDTRPLPTPAKTPASPQQKPTPTPKPTKKPEAVE